MDRRHFMQHCAWLATIASSSSLFGQQIIQNHSKLSKDRKGAILIWLGGGPPTIDMWDLKPDAKEGGPFKPISTTGDFQISEHMPLLAKLGKDFSIVRDMSTREADHMRGASYLHTAFPPSPTVEYPSLGSMVAFELASTRPELEIPPFFSINTGSYGAGFLGTSWNPFVVNSNGKVTNLGESPERLDTKMKFLSSIENNFVDSNRGELPSDHKKLLEKTLKLNTSNQMLALKIDKEPKSVLDSYGSSGFGRSALMARKLLQEGVPFVEIGLGGWDLHAMTHKTLSEQRLPELDKVVSSLILDLKALDMWDTTAIIMMGEFGRTPRINQDAGRDHWAATWSAFLSGGLIKGGQAIGATSSDGKETVGGMHGSPELVATVLKALGIDTNKKYTTKKGRPMKIANGGQPINALIV